MMVPTVDLTEKELRVVQLVECGADVATIAAEMGVAPSTIRTKVKKLRSRLGAESMVDLPGKARRLGVVLGPCADEWVAAPEYEVCDTCGAVNHGNAFCPTCRSHWPGGDPLLSDEDEVEPDAWIA